MQNVRSHDIDLQLLHASFEITYKHSATNHWQKYRKIITTITLQNKSETIGHKNMEIKMKTKVLWAAVECLGSTEKTQKIVLQMSFDIIIARYIQQNETFSSWGQNWQNARHTPEFYIQITLSMNAHLCAVYFGQTFMKTERNGDGKESRFFILQCIVNLHLTPSNIKQQQHKRPNFSVSGFPVFFAGTFWMYFSVVFFLEY